MMSTPKRAGCAKVIVSYASLSTQSIGYILDDIFRIRLCCVKYGKQVRFVYIVHTGIIQYKWFCLVDRRWVRDAAATHGIATSQYASNKHCMTVAHLFRLLLLVFLFVLFANVCAAWCVPMGIGSFDSKVWAYNINTYKYDSKI